MSNAIVSLALAIGQQHQGQHQQHLQVQERQQRLQTGHSYSTASQVLATRLAKATGTSREVPEARQLQWKQEDSQSGPGTNQDERAPNGPPVVPEIMEQDLQQDPDLIEALWSIINNVHQA